MIISFACRLTLAGLVLFQMREAMGQQPATASAPGAPVQRMMRLTPALPAGSFPAAAPASQEQLLATAGVPVAASNPELEQQKKPLLQQLFFDRRPSAILKSWSMTLEQELAESEPEKSAEEQPAAVASVPDAESPSTEPLTDEQKAAKEAARKAAEESAAKAAELRKQAQEFRTQIRSLQRAVTLSQWDQARILFAAFSEADRRTIFERLLTSLVQGPPDSPRDRNGQIIGEKNVMTGVDVIAVAELSPESVLAENHVGLLGQLARECQSEGESAEAFVKALRQHTAADIADRRIDGRHSAKILMAAGRAAEAQEFLPPFDQVHSGTDSEAMELFANACMARMQTDHDQKTELMEQAWMVTQALLALPIAEKSADLSVEQLRGRDQLRRRQQEALRRAVSLVPALRKELGEAWLVESFTREPERGQRLLYGIGSGTAKAMAEYAGQADERLKLLKLQQTALNSLFEKVPDRAPQWKEALHLMAVNWLREATHSAQFDRSTQRGPMMQRDEFGNLFWTSEQAMGAVPPNGRSVTVAAIPSGKVLDAKPSDAWLDYLGETYRPSLAIATARLHLRVKEENLAFPQIEMLAGTHRDIARELVDEFLKVWADNHDPNSQSRRTNLYMFSFGYSERLSGIPLTRSRQERNVAELSEWVKRIRRLPIEKIDETWISSAFSRVYSTAEVYQLKDLEAVFGSVDTLEPGTLAALLSTMRGNLNGVWRMPQVQQDAKTNRKKKDIEQEVLAGYGNALQMAEKGLADHPSDWKLLGVKYSLIHDLNNYQSELSESADFTSKRREALAGLARAAEAYAAVASELKENEYSVNPFNTWFCAALGDCDVNRITPERVPLLDQMPLIRASLASLPEPCRDKHLDMFANDIFTRMSSVNPAVKYRYVRESLAIAGNRPQGMEARKLLDYYSDLVTEIQLDAEIDGTHKVGHDQPFGVLVSLRHTQAIERESGGFSRYLQNQNSGGGYYYNNGRPNEDYRDKFEKAARESLNEHFEILSVTFEPESVRSRALAEPGWRSTPYAYLLLKARGPEIDRVPPLRLDLDFLDTTGYVVLPVESSAISIDCAATADGRPVHELSLTQTLDERQSKDGRLMLEVKAVAKGLVPELNELIDLKFDDFEVASTEDNGVLLSRFDPDSEQPVIVSERLWTMTLRDRRDSNASPSQTFRFPGTLASEVKEVVYQRYDDADLKTVEQSVALVSHYDEPKSRAIYFFALIPVLLTGAALVWRIVRRGPATTSSVAQAFRVPAEITPFTVLRLLKDIEQKANLQPSEKNQLSTSIHRIESYYFADQRESAPPDLDREARTWVSQSAGSH